MRDVLRGLDLDGAMVTALLGPTNTGKTHRAIQALTGARSGMIGLPLRLLAREVYDRLCAEKGTDQVALVTGEEKIVPPGARYFACTVEAMPLDRPVDVLAVDEVQLAADRTRGHVFTDRILRARGLQHTLLLGSDTMTDLLEELVPTVRVRSAQRLSELHHAEPRKLTSLPRRSAVVGFSVQRVYELAERLKARHGGAAVVLGALSPRARNAQVALYQSGEVPYLVATDAIGMGLNLDVDHVAFADIQKFDGRHSRPLTPAELGQIAGRAGRFTRDGSFSTLTECDPLDAETIERIEQHRFEPVEQLWWRAPEPETSSLDALLHSLEQSPPSRRFRRMRDADDHVVLQQLAAREDVRALSNDPAAVELLWQVAQVPDFRKTLTDSHAELLAQVFTQLVQHGRLSETWVAGRIERLDSVGGDLDALMTRIAWVRTWSYIAHRRGWLVDQRGWQGRTQQIEHRLSDAVHEALTRRFVERRLRLRVADLDGVVQIDGDDVVVDGELVGVARGLDLQLRTGVRLGGAVRREVQRRLAERVTELVNAPDDAIALDERGELRWQGRRVATLTAGPDWREPVLRVARTIELPDGLRQQLTERLQGWVDARIGWLLAPVRETETCTAACRALLYRLERNLLCLPRSEVDDVLPQLDANDRKALARRDVRLGQRIVYVASRLKPDAVGLRIQLDGIARGRELLRAAPAASAVSVPADGRSAEEWLRAGFLLAGPRAVRVDVAESVAALLRRHRGPGLPDGLASRLGCRRDEEVAVAEGLVGPRRRGSKRRSRRRGSR